MRGRLATCTLLMCSLRDQVLAEVSGCLAGGALRHRALVEMRRRRSRAILTAWALSGGTRSTEPLTRSARSVPPSPKCGHDSGPKLAAGRMLYEMSRPGYQEPAHLWLSHLQETAVASASPTACFVAQAGSRRTHAGKVPAMASVLSGNRS